MADEPLLNHGNNVERNYGTINQYITHQQPRTPQGQLPKRMRVALLSGLATAALGAWGFYSPAKASKAYYCASGNTVKYHVSPRCRGLDNCTARVSTTTLARVESRHLEPCQVCHK